MDVFNVGRRSSDFLHYSTGMVTRGTNQQSSAPYNRRIVLDVIRRHGSLSRKEIVERVALSPQTVANITSDLESVGLVVARRLKVQKSRGQPPIVFELNPNGGTSVSYTHLTLPTIYSV